MYDEIVVCEGWLKKEEGSIIKRWNTKYFQLTGVILTQYSDHPSKCKTFEWKLDISDKKGLNIDIIDKEETTRSKIQMEEFFFRIQTTKTSSIQFCCETQQQCTEWVVSMKNSINKKAYARSRRMSMLPEIVSEKENDMEKLIKLIQNKTSKEDNLVVGLNYLLFWYRKVLKKIKEYTENYQEYQFKLHQRIQEVEVKGIEFSENQGDKLDRTSHLLLELLNVFQKKKLQKLEAKEAFIRFLVVKLCKNKPKLPKLSKFKIEMKSNFSRDVKELKKDIKELTIQIDEISVDLMDRFIKYTENIVKEQKKMKDILLNQQLKLTDRLKLKNKTTDEEIVVVETSTQNELLEIGIQIILKELSLCDLKIDIAESYFSKKDLHVKYLYHTEKEMKQLWVSIFNENPMVETISTLIKHLKLEQISLTHQNIKNYLHHLHEMSEESSKNFEDYTNISSGLNQELEGLKTNTFNIQYNYIFFAQTKLNLIRKQIQLEKTKIELISDKTKEIINLELEFQTLSQRTTFDIDTTIIECDFILNDWKSIHEPFMIEFNNQIFEFEKEIEKIKSDLTSVKQIMTVSPIKKKTNQSIYEILLDETSYERKYLNNFILQCKPNEQREDFYYLKNAKLFISDLTEIIEENRIGMKYEKNEIYESIEKVLFNKIYDEFFVIFQDSINDEKFRTNSKLYSKTILGDLLQIKDFHQFERDFGDGIQILSQLSEHKTPSSKLISVYCASKRILETIESQSENSFICGDDFLPVLICCLSWTGLKNIFTQINFIKHLASDLSLVSEEGYYFSSMESAARFVADYNSKNE